MTDVYVAGIGSTVFGRHRERSVRELAAEAVGAALADAGAEPSHVEAAYFGNATQGHLEGQLMIGGQIALLGAGFSGLPIYNVENACATGSTAFHLAARHIRAGDAEVVLAAGAEKMNHPDRERMFGVFDGGWDVARAEENQAALAALGEGVEVPAEFQREGSFSKFMEIYAAWCRYHMKHFGLTLRQLAVVASKNHGHSAGNPLAQYRDPFSVEEVMAAKAVCYPLTNPMCAPVTDGAAAAVLASEAGLRRLGVDASRAVRVRASVMRSSTHREYGDLAHHITRRAAEAAYEAAGLGPEDMDLAEVHDATAMGEIVQTENLGFCEMGAGGELAESGATTLGGRIPVNPSGGLESKGHPIGATGLGQIGELVVQLRGEAGARQVPAPAWGSRRTAAASTVARKRRRTSES